MQRTTDVTINSDSFKMPHKMFEQIRHEEMVTEKTDELVVSYDTKYMKHFHSYKLKFAK